MHATLALALACTLTLSGCASWDRIWNGKVVEDDFNHDAPALPGSTTHAEVPPSDPYTPAPPTTSPPELVSPPPSTGEGDSPPPPPGNQGAAWEAAFPCPEGVFIEAVQGAQAFLSNLTGHHVSETLAGQVNGSYVYEERLFDLDNETLAYASHESHVRKVAVASEYAVLGAQSYRGRDDAPPGPAWRLVPEATPGIHHPLQSWTQAPVSALEGECVGDAAQPTVLARLVEANATEVRIEAQRPVRAVLRSPNVDLDITYDHSPAPPELDAMLPRQAAQVTWAKDGNSSVVRFGDTRSLDGHLVLHAVDGQGYSIFAVALTASFTEQRDGAYVSYQDDGDGYWGPGDEVSWGGRSAGIRLLDGWAGEFTATP